MSTEDLLGESHSEELASVLQDAGSQDDESVPVGVTQSKKDVNPLTAEVISKGISLLAKTGNGLSYAYTKLELHALELTGIQILENYPHLRYVNLSENRLIQADGLENLAYLLSVDLSNNDIESVSASLSNMAYLQVANFSKNKIKSFEATSWPMIKWINLNENKLSEFQLVEFPELTTIEARANALATTECLANLANLKSAYLAANSIEKIQSLEGLSNLTILHLRDNKIATLDGFTEDLTSLATLNLRGNAVAEVQELNKLAILPALTSLSLTDCPVTAAPNYRLEVITRIPQLVRLDKEDITDTEREEAEAFKQEALEAAQAAAAAEEEAQRLLEEEKAAEAQKASEEDEENKEADAVDEEKVVVDGDEQVDVAEDEQAADVEEESAEAE
ncbi:MAG: hypothetical protein SGCHY_002068 [Lobulomycetales sp.]